MRLSTKLIATFGLLLFFMTAIAQDNVQRELKEITLSGTGHELGFEHGKKLKGDIAAIVAAWKANTTKQLGKDADIVLEEFFAYADFEGAIEQWTPNLLDEVRGIAEGSGQEFNDVFVLNLLDEFWVFINEKSNHHCSGMGAPAQNGNPAYISQNMDLENYTDGFQVVMRLEPTDSRPEQLILTYPGLIALNGLNKNGIGVCVNTLMQLTASNTGLPVAFVVRGILNSRDKQEALTFVQKVSHASGQNYIIGVENQVYDYEASANKVVRYNPKNANGTVYHTNHPIVNDDIKPWFSEYDPTLEEKPTSSNSHLRFYAVESRLADNSFITLDVFKDALRSKDNPNNPVCRTNAHNGRGFTFASTIMTLGKKPYLEVLAGPPDESEFRRIGF